MMNAQWDRVLGLIFFVLAMIGFLRTDRVIESLIVLLMSVVYMKSADLKDMLKR
jgi:hypothetical protein